MDLATPSATTLSSEMVTPQTHLQSQSGQLRFGTRAYARRLYLILAACLLSIVWVAPCCVTHAAVLREDSVPILPWPLGAGAGGVLHGSRLRVSQRSRRDTVSNKHLTWHTLETTTTDAPSNSSFRQRVNDKFLSSLETDGSVTGAVDFLSQVTPPHWSSSDPFPTDPTRPPATPTEVQQATTQSTTSPTTTSSPPTYSGKEISLLPEETYMVPISSTVSFWFAGSTTEVGNILKVNADVIESGDLETKNRTEPLVINKHRRFLFFPCWPSSHIHPENKEPPWVKDIGKPYIFPALLLVSWLFTSVALILHILIPELRANMGKIFMCYILSLWLKCITTPSSLFLSLCAPDFAKEKQACIAIAFVSYMLSMAYRFWLNIMCFDIWRKVSNLVCLQHVRPVRLLYYHLWGWGMPTLFGLLALLIREFASANIIKPGFMNDGQCWFDRADPTHQFLYMNLPGGFLHIANIGFVIKTRQNCSLMQQTSIPETQESNNDSVGRIHATTNYINEFSLQFRILNFMIGLWFLWSICLFIRYLSDMWQFQVFPGILISLQGLIIFFIFISNNHKRQLIQRKYPFLKFNNWCITLESKSITRQQSSSISEASSERRKKLSVMSITSLTSLFGSSSATPNEDIAEHVPVQELSSVSSASYNNTSEGGSVHFNLSLNRAHSLPPKEDTQSLNGGSICEVAMSFDKEELNSNTRNARKLCHIPDLSELTLNPSNLTLSRSVSCTYPQPNIAMDANPVNVPVSKTLDDRTEYYVDHQLT